MEKHVPGGEREISGRPGPPDTQSLKKATLPAQKGGWRPELARAADARFRHALGVTANHVWTYQLVYAIGTRTF